MRARGEWAREFLYLALDVLQLNRLFRFLNRGNIKVLLYHDIVDVREFRKHVLYLKDYYHLISISQEGDWSELSRSRVNVLLTFDDGFVSNYEVAVKVLIDLGVKGCFFLISDCVKNGGYPGFVSKYAEPGQPVPDRYRVLTVTQLQEMLKGGMTIGTHTCTHRDFSTLGDVEAVQDALESKRYFEQFTKGEVRLLAFPWGSYRSGLVDVLGPYFRRIFLVQHGFCRPDDRLVRRNEVASFRHMRAGASGALDFMRALMRYG